MNISWLPDSQSLEIAGALTRDTLSEDGWKTLRSYWDKSNSSVLRICLSKTNQIDSAGVAWLLNLKRDASRHNSVVVFTDLPDNASNLAKLSDVDDLIAN